MQDKSALPPMTPIMARPASRSEVKPSRTSQSKLEAPRMPPGKGSLELICAEAKHVQAEDEEEEEQGCCCFGRK